jgi:hypothetical protein
LLDITTDTCIAWTAQNKHGGNPYIRVKECRKGEGCKVLVVVMVTIATTMMWVGFNTMLLSPTEHDDDALQIMRRLCLGEWDD